MLFRSTIGIVAGNLLPSRIVSGLSVALYGMFLAVIIPQAKKDRIVAVLIVVSFIISYLVSRLELLGNISSGTQIIILTLVIAGLAAILFPVKEGEGEESGA